MSCVLGLEVNLPAASGSDPALMGELPMKKKILYIAAIIICLSIIGGGTFAYYTATDTARNVITTGGIDVQVVEQQLADGSLQPYPSDRITVLPSTTVSKIVSVQSNQQAAWVRMKYTVTFFDSGGNAMSHSADELDKLITVEPDNSRWSFSDGWWYYDTAIASGETASPLFEKVIFSGPNMGNEYQNTTVEIVVTAQAVQQANNGTTPLEALGWPVED